MFKDISHKLSVKITQINLYIYMFKDKKQIYEKIYIQRKIKLK